MTTPTLTTLIERLEQDLPGADPVERVATARLRAATLADLGDQLVDHYVAAARAAGCSWARIGEALGVSRQAAQQRPGQSSFAQFTDRARQVMVFAQDVARANHGAHITSEHILHGVLEVGEGVGAKTVRALADSVDQLRAQLHTLLPRDAETPPARLPFAEVGRRVIDETGRVSTELGHTFVGTEHLLLGILRVDCPASALLNRHGVTLDRATESVTETLSAMVAERARLMADIVEPDGSPDRR